MRTCSKVCGHRKKTIKCCWRHNFLIAGSVCDVGPRTLAHSWRSSWSHRSWTGWRSGVCGAGFLNVFRPRMNSVSFWSVEMRDSVHILLSTVCLVCMWTCSSAEALFPLRHHSHVADHHSHHEGSSGPDRVSPAVRQSGESHRPGLQVCVFQQRWNFNFLSPHRLRKTSC